MGEKGKLGAGGSVATSAWDLARLLGANPVYTAGLDLGFPGKRTHCRGVYTEDLWLCGSNRLAPLEGSSFRYLHDIGLFPVRSASGSLTLTDRRMLLYKWWFENQLMIRADVTSFTLSPDSAAIQGMPLAALEEVLALPVVRPEIAERMAGARSRGADSAARERLAHALSTAVAQLESQLERLESLALHGLALSRTLGTDHRGPGGSRPLRARSGRGRQQHPRGLRAQYRRVSDPVDHPRDFRRGRSQVRPRGDRGPQRSHVRRNRRVRGMAEETSRRAMASEENRWRAFLLRVLPRPPIF